MCTTLKQLDPAPRLVPIKTKLASPGGPLICKGQFAVEAEVNQQRYGFLVLVTAGTSTDNFLSRSVAVHMGLIRHLDTLNLKDDIFGDIGPLDCNLVKIKLKPGAIPYSVMCGPTHRHPYSPSRRSRTSNVWRSMVLSRRLLVRHSTGVHLWSQSQRRTRSGYV